MAKISQISDDEILKMIEKHEKILKKLYKEKTKRGLDPSEPEMKEFAYDSPDSDGTGTDTSTVTSEAYAFDLGKEGITQENILSNLAPGDDDAGENTASYRITQILNLDKKQLDELNKKEEDKRKKDDVKKKEHEANKDKPKGRLG